MIKKDFLPESILNSFCTELNDLKLQAENVETLSLEGTKLIQRCFDLIDLARTGKTKGLEALWKHVLNNPITMTMKEWSDPETFRPSEWFLMSFFSKVRQYTGLFVFNRRPEIDFRSVNDGDLSDLLNLVPWYEMKVCLHCGKYFSSHKQTKKHCSPKCRIAKNQPKPTDKITSRGRIRRQIQRLLLDHGHTLETTIQKIKDTKRYKPLIKKYKFNIKKMADNIFEKHKDILKGRP